MAQRNFLAFDLGAESGRAVMGVLEGGRLRLEEKHRFVNPTGRIRGGLHWNLLAQWEELKAGLRKAAGEATGGGRARIDGIGIDTWGVDFGLIGRDGEVLANPWHYRDARNEGMLDRAAAKVGREAIFSATGIQFLPFNSLYQLLAIKEAGGRMLESAETLLFMPDLFNYLFTGGVRKAELSIASTSQMLDPRSRGWAVGLLDQLDLPTRLLPELAPPGTLLAPLCGEVAKECGVGRIPVIAPACHDTASAVAAVPAAPGAADWCYISSGTWSLMGVELDEPLINDRSLAYNYTNELGVGGKVRFLRNIMGMWPVQECRRQWQRDGYEHTYSELAGMAARATPFVAAIDLDYKPLASPGDMPNKIIDFCQLTRQKPPVTRGEYVRTLLESLALAYRRTLEGMEDVLGRRMEVIHIVGGACQNELLNQMTADACGRPVIAGPVEATAIGNLLVQAMATGDVPNMSALRDIVRNSFDVKRHDPHPAARWEQAYAHYRSILGKF